MAKATKPSITLEDGEIHVRAHKRTERHLVVTMDQTAPNGDHRSSTHKVLVADAEVVKARAELGLAEYPVGDAHFSEPPAFTGGKVAVELLTAAGESLAKAVLDLG